MNSDHWGDGSVSIRCRCYADPARFLPGWKWLLGSELSLAQDPAAQRQRSTSLSDLLSGHGPAASAPGAWRGRQNVRGDVGAGRATDRGERRLPSDVRRSDLLASCPQNVRRTAKSNAPDSRIRKQDTLPPMKRTAIGTQIDARSLYSYTRKSAFCWGFQANQTLAIVILLCLPNECSPQGPQPRSMSLVDVPAVSPPVCAQFRLERHAGGDRQPRLRTSRHRRERMSGTRWQDASVRATLGVG